MSHASPAIPDDAWERLAPFMTDLRRLRMIKAAAERTRHLRLVLQDIHNPHNVSACLRSAEAFGVQDVDIVTLKPAKFRPSTAARGVAHWLTTRRYRAVEDCVSQLRHQGYRIIAGVPHAKALPLHEVPIDQPLALVFGNEHDGVDPSWLKEIDVAFTIPMVGMVESLNISVCAAITLQYLTHAARSSLDPRVYHLADQERKTLLNDWACRHVANWEVILERIRHSESSL
jgi:tRNA (guanosine-2'-O-)-methyltransferase